MCNLYRITANRAAILAPFRVVNRYVGNQQAEIRNGATKEFEACHYQVENKRSRFKIVGKYSTNFIENWIDTGKLLGTMRLNQLP